MSMASPGVAEAGSSQGWSKSFSFAGTLVLFGFITVYLRAILVPFVLATFLAYLVRPISERVSSCGCCGRRRRGAREEEERLLADTEADDHDDDDREYMHHTPPIHRLGQDYRDMHSPEARQRVIRKVQTRIERTLPRWVGVLLAMALAIGVMAGLLLALFAALTSVETKIPRYRERAQLLWTENLNAAGRTLDLDLSELRGLPSRLFPTFAGAIVTTSLSLVVDIFLVIVFLSFLLLQPPAPHTSLRKKIDDSVSRYIILKSLTSLAIAGTVYVTMIAVGFPLALLLGLSTFVLNFIPNLGPLISVLLPVLVAFLDSAVTQQTALSAIGVSVGAHVIMGNICEPLLFGRQFQMNPVIILFSLGVWSILWGPVGAVLAVPLTSVLRIAANYLLENQIGMPYIAVVSSLLGGEPLDDLLNGGRHRPRSGIAERDLMGPEDIKIAKAG
tara:strand:+ start:537 stop:1874 length:1338 start_codon:yes stop_codon:yes gene_type:complete